MKMRKPSPFLKPLGATLIGIASAHWHTVSCLFLVPIFVISAVAAMYTHNKSSRTFAQATMLIFFAITGALVFNLQKTHILAQSAAVVDQLITLDGTITDKDAWGNRQQSDVLRLNVTSVHFCSTQTVSNVSFDLLCYFPYKTSFMVGDCVKIPNTTIPKPNIPTRSGNTGYEDYLAKEGVISSLFFHTAHQCKLIQRPFFSISRWMWKLRNASYYGLKKKLSPTAFRYIGLIFFGNKQQEEIANLRSTFNLWGLAHFLARAGLHIVFFIFIWSSFFSFFPIPLFIKRMLLICLCSAYNMLSWSSIPFTRALYAFLCIKSGELFHYQTHYLHILSLLCLAIVLFNPLQLFFLDFQLSFGLTFGLIFLAHQSQYLDHKKLR